MLMRQLKRPSFASNQTYHAQGNPIGFRRISRGTIRICVYLCPSVVSGRKSRMNGVHGHCATSNGEYASWSPLGVASYRYCALICDQRSDGADPAYQDNAQPIRMPET